MEGPGAFVDVSSIHVQFRLRECLIFREAVLVATVSVCFALISETSSCLGLCRDLGCLKSLRSFELGLLTQGLRYVCMWQLYVLHALMHVV